MTRVLSISQILVYYDFPELFVAMDAAGTRYLSLLAETTSERTNYFATPISAQRLGRFMKGEVDLREIFESPEVAEWLHFQSVDEPIEAIVWSKPALPRDFLPDEGFRLRMEVNDQYILEEVLEKDNAVVHLALSDSLDSDSIGADDLGQVVFLYQNLLENAFKKTMSQSNIREKKSFLIPQNYKLRAFASSSGSFNLHLYSTSQADLFGRRVIEVALQKLEELTRDIADENEYVLALRTVKGHTISALKRLVEFVAQRDLRVKQKWYTTGQERINLTIIDKEKAMRIASILSQSEELAEESRILLGSFVQIDIEKGTWRILSTEDGREYSGKGSRELLQGITVESVVYKLLCKEIVEQIRVTEKEKFSYVLVNIERIDDSY